MLEQRTLLSANLAFAVAGPSGGQDFAVATDLSGDAYVLGTDAVYKFTASGTQLWAAPYSASSGINQKEGLAVDASGNVYIAGNFGNSAGNPAKFGGASLASAGGSDGYLAKLDSDGNFLWAQSFGGTGSDAAYGVAVDAAGNAFVTGDFSATATFGQGANAVNLQSAGGTDAFIAKVAPTGDLTWARSVGGTGGDNARSIAVDSLGDAYVTGEFSGTADFDRANPGVHQLTTFFGASYILKLDAGGNYLWAKELNGTNLPQGDGRSEGDAITVDNAGNVYATGIFGGPVNLDPSGGTDIVNANFVFPDAYVLKLDSSGGFAWAADLHNVSGSNPFGGLAASGIAVDGQGNVYTTGNFQGIADFDPGSGAANRLSAGGVDAYVSILDRQGNYAGVAVAGESGSDFGWGIAATATGNIYVAGSFSNTIDFDPGPGVDNVSANGIWDGFVWGLSYPPQAIAGVVWNDQNQDGVRQPNEPGLPGTPVTLYQGTPGSGVQVATTVSDSLGLYSFKGLSTGVSYYIQVSTPPGDALTAQNAGSDLTLDSNVSVVTGRSAAIVLSANQTAVANAGLQVSASPPTFGVAFGVKTIGFTEGSSIVADPSGNFYVAGSFDGSSVFGSGPGAVTLSTGANNDFVAKYSPGGALIWVRQAVSSFWQYGPKLQLDALGNVYVSGSITGQTTFGSTVIAASSGTAFLWKLDGDGNTLWAKSVIGGAANNSVGMAVDELGNAYVVGAFSGTSTINTVPTATTLTATGSDDIFAVKYGPDGTPIWAEHFGAAGKYDGADSVAIDPGGNPILTGTFGSSVQLGTFTLSGSSTTDFVAKLNSSDGSVAWADALASSVSSGPSPLGITNPLNRIAIDAAGNVYSTGRFNGTLQLDPTSATDLTAYGSNATFISKLDNSGRFVWGKALLPGSGGYDVEGYGIAVDQQGNVYTTGEFAQTLNFNPAGSPAANLTAIGASYDIYISKLDKNGAYVSAEQFGGSGEDQGTAIAVDAAGNVYATGVSEGPANFSPPPGTFNVGASGDRDIFVLKLGTAGLASSVNSAPSFTIAGPTQQVLENSGPQTAPGFISSIVAGPAGESNEVLTTTISNDNNALFATQPAIDLATGTLTYAPAADASGVAHVTLTLQNNGGTAGGGGDTFSQTFSITINPINQAPSFTEGPDETVNENAGAQTANAWATNISAGPPNESGQLLNFIVTSDNASLFAAQPAIDPSGNLTFTPAANTSGVAHVTVELHDNGGTANGGVDTSAPQTFTITVNFVNQPPSFTAGGDQSVLENAGPQTVSGWATNISPGPNEASQTVDFQVSDDNPSMFSVQPAIDSNGKLTYTPAPDANGIAHVTVVLHDNGGTANGGIDNSAPQIFAISITTVNQPPSFTAGADQTVNEDAGAQTVAGWATNISPGAANESWQTLNFLVSSDNSALFSAQPSIDPATGDLTYTPAPNAFGVAHVTVELHDNGGTASGGVDTSAPQTFTITVNFVNQPPSFTAGGDQSVMENAGPQTVSGWATNISPGPNEASQTVDFQASDDNTSLFSVQPAIDSNGNLTYTPAPNANGVAHVTVVLHDNGGTANGGVDTSASQTFAITLSVVNQPPSFTAGADQTVNEDAGAQTVAGWATNISAGPANEAGQTLNFIVSSDNSSLFSSQPSIDPATGDLTYTPAPNANGVAHVTVVLHDNGGTANGGVDTSAPQTFTITVNFVNQPPSFTAGADQTINENSGEEIVVGWAKNISAGPLNESSQTVHFQVSSDNPALFSLQPSLDANGILTYQAAPHMNGVSHVTVQLFDNGGTANGGVDASAPVTFTITVNPVNEPPSFTAGADQTIDEDAGPQTVAGWATNVSAGPNEASQTVNFLVSYDNNSLFSAQPAIDASGTLTYTPAPNAYGVAHVTVVLHDNGGTANGGVDTSSPQTFTITVNPVNDPPSFTAGADQTVNEDSAPQTVAGWATNISDGPNETGQTLDFQVGSDNSALFSSQPAIDPASGTLAYAPAPNAYGVAHVTVMLHDDGGTANGGVETSAPQVFTITINQVNDAPSFTAGGDQTVNEDAGPQSVSGWAASISAGPNEATQTLNFLVSTDNSSLFSAGPSIDPVSGALTYTPAPNANGVAHVTVQLHDDGGTANGGVDTSAPQTFTITVNAVNDPPSFTAGADQSVNQDSGPQAVAGWATSISDGPNETGQTLNFLVSNDNPSLFATPPAIDANGTLTYAPAAHAFGVAHVTVQLHDDGGTANGGVDTSAPQTFTITVNFVNQPPSFTVGPDQAADENAPAQTVASWATNISQGAFETGQTLDFQVSSDNSALFSVQPAIDPTGALSYAPAANISGVAHVTVTLHDDGGTANGGQDTSASQTFTITINPVNQAPSFQAGPDETVDEDSGPQTFVSWAANVSAGPNESSQTVDFVVSTDNPGLFSAGPAIDAAGNLTFTPALHTPGTANVTVTLHDDGGTANGGVDASSPQTFEIVVNPVNHAPTVAAPVANLTLDENAADVMLNVAGVFDDVDIPNGDHLTVSLAGNDNGSLVGATLSNGMLALHLFKDQFGAAQLDLRAVDDSGAKVDDVFTVTVNAVNQPPVFIKGADQRVPEDAGAVVVAGWATGVSPGPANEAGQTLSFQLAGNTNPSLFAVQPSVDPATGALTFTPAPGVSGTATISLALKDDGGTAHGGVDTSAPQSFRITVNGAPVAQADTFVLSNSSSSASLAGGVLANDSDPNGDALTAHLVDGPAHGTLTLNADGSFTYAKGADFAGLDEFTYQASDGLANSGIVTVRVISYEASIVDKLYEQVLHREAEDAGLAYWTNQIQNGAPYSEVAQGIFESNERLDPIIEQYYHDFLLRSPDASGLDYWRDQVWKRDGGPENVIAGMISSPEFFQSAGGTNADWIQALYQRLLNRPADSLGLSFWEYQLDQHLETEDQVVLGFTQSDENFTNLIDGFYQQYLQRAPDSTELNNMLAQMRTGATQRDIQVEIIDTDEYRNTPPAPADGIAVRFVP